MPRSGGAAAAGRSRRKRKVVDYNEDNLAFKQLAVHNPVVRRKTTVKTEKQPNGSGGQAEASSGNPIPKKMKKVKQESGRSNAEDDDVAALVNEMLQKPCIDPVKRNKNGTLCFKDHPEFTPNLAPYQVLQLGAFGGTYFRPIKSAVTNAKYRNVHREFPKKWFEGFVAFIRWFGSVAGRWPLSDTAV